MSSAKILKGVPPVYYGAFHGITPFPICLKAVSDYIGDPLDYIYASVISGGAFRFAWNTEMLDGGNVDITHTYADPEKAFRNAITALGREFHMLWREPNPWDKTGSSSKEEFKAFIKAQIDAGKPVISLGPVGPPEAGIITGYLGDGDTLRGWSLFQFMSQNATDANYFTTDKWWDEGEFFGVMALGEVIGPRATEATIIENAIAALEGRQEGKFAKGIAAYDAWKQALLAAKEADFVIDPDWQQSLAMMCQGDATDCLMDGRNSAAKYFEQLAQKHPEQPKYGEIAAQFAIIPATIMEKIFGILGSHERALKENLALEPIENRRKIAAVIDELKAADEKALALMKSL